MKSYRAIAFAIAGVCLPFASLSAHAADMKVLASTAVKSVLEEMGPQFEKATGNTISFTFGPAAVLKAQIDKGAAFDVAILTVPLINELVTAGKIDGRSQAIVAQGGLGVAMRAGTPKPDVSTPEAFKKMLLNAKSIGFNRQGASRAATEAIFAKLGIAGDIKSKIKLLQTGASEGVVNGEVEVGLGPASDILAASGAELVGLFPKELEWYLVLPAGVAVASKNTSAAELLIDFLKSPAGAAVLKSKGMEPG